MGVSGAGKTLVGRMLAQTLDWEFLDADDFHPSANIQKMTSGVPLEPEDRVAWLEAMRAALLELDRDAANAVLACSALRQSFRDRLREGFADMRFVYLKAGRDLIRARVAARRDHFMPASLVDSQFETLEEPTDAIVVDASKPPPEIVAEILRALR